VSVAFVDAHREEFGVEFICKHLQVAPSTYYATRKRLIAPSARAVRDALMMQVLLTLWIANRKVYGAHKLWKAAGRAGHDIGRDQVARLMRQLGIEGVSRLRKKVFTTRQNPDVSRAPDLVNRQFKAQRPDALWVTDLTYVPTRSGMAYVCFIVDAFSRRIVGWRVAANMKTEMVLDALEMARASRGSHRLIGLVTHSDAGSIHLGALHRATRRDRRPPLDRDGRGLLRQRPRRDNQRSVQDRVRLRPGHPRLGRRRRARARDPVVGALVQRDTAARALQRRPASRARSSVLCCPTDQPRRGWNPIERASIRPSAVHFTPTSSSWLNLVERWFRELTDKALRRGVFHSVPNLIAKIEAYLDAHNDQPKPFIWTATADDILAKVARGRVALQTVNQ
jgi:transposase InsO family protein